MDLDYLQKAWTTLLDWDLFCYKFELDWRNELTKKRLEKYEKCLGLSAQQFEIQSNL